MDQRFDDRLGEKLVTEPAGSPVFQPLSRFAPGPDTTLLDLPPDLAEDIEQARVARQPGDLRLIADEVMGLPFEQAALRAAAVALEDVGDDVGAQRAWERVRVARPDDLQANRALAGIYRRLGQLVLSDEAITRALGSGTLAMASRAELYAGLGSNSKRRWVAEWREADALNRARVALWSRELEVSFRFYRRGFDEDLNHWHSGLNALALAKITLELAGRCPDVWRNRFETDAEADRELERLESEVAELTSVVRASLNSARVRIRQTGTDDFWIDFRIELSVADLRFLTSNEPESVTSAYEAALSRVRVLGSGARRAIREQIEMYRDLGVLMKNAVPVLEMLGVMSTGVTVPVHPLVFSGHMIDAPGRVYPRFPASQVGIARERIRDAIREIAAAAAERQERIVGMAGASDGGDLLFHEACAELGIDTEVFLPVPELAYRATAMSGQPSRWAERYHAVLSRAKEKKEDRVHVLAPTDTLPAWLQSRPTYSTWQRNNRWILHHAWASTTVDRVTVLALWNGETGDGRGGVADMVAAAQAGGADVIIIDTVALVHLMTSGVDEPTRIGGSVSAPFEMAMSNPGSFNLYSPVDYDAGDLPAVERVFISHRRADKPLAEAVAAVLGAGHLHYWLDEDDQDAQLAADLGMAGDQALVFSIERGVRHCTQMLGLLSAETRGSWWVPYEIGFSRSQGANTSYLVLESVPEMEELPEYARLAANYWSVDELVRWAVSLAGGNMHAVAAPLDAALVARLEQFVPRRPQEPVIPQLAASAVSAMGQLFDRRTHQVLRLTSAERFMWLPTSGGLVRALAYDLYAPLAFYQLRSSALAGPEKDILALIYRSVTLHYELARMSPAINYDPQAQGWRHRRYLEPASSWLQGLSMEQLKERLGRFFIVPDMDQGQRLATREEFKAEFDRVLRSGAEHDKRSLGVLVNPLFGFTPEDRPVFLRVLALQSLLYRQLAGRLPRVPFEDRLIAKVEQFVRNLKG
jgi:hypothetical protein